MQRIFREPLLHFLLLGAGLFILYSLMSKPDANVATDQIFVTEGLVENLAAGFARIWQRPPADSELNGLIQDWVREEVATREAKALGLDKDDTVIRRRLRQKLEFVSDDIAAQRVPTDADLIAYMQAHPGSFRVEPRFTFSQVYLSLEKHGVNLARDAAQLLVQLNQTNSQVDLAAAGDPFLLEQKFAAVSRAEIAKQFGEQFTTKLADLTPGQWQGPIKSGYGVHLVLVTERLEGGLPALADVRDVVVREWINARRLKTNDEFYRELLKHYTVTIESPDLKAMKPALPK